jgi:hypothetical protein
VFVLKWLPDESLQLWGMHGFLYIFLRGIWPPANPRIANLGPSVQVTGGLVDIYESYGSSVGSRTLQAESCLRMDRRRSFHPVGVSTSYGGSAFGKLPP